MTRSITMSVVTAGAAVLVACSNSSSPAKQHSNTAGGGALATASISGVGVVLVNADGLTLYSAAQEMHGAIACTGDCVKFWVPATGSLAGAPAAERAALGTIKRPDTGAEQLTYHGAPLYTFVEDHSSGQATGNGVSDAFAGHHFTWHAVVVSAAAKTPTTSTSTSSAGYPVY